MSIEGKGAMGEESKKKSALVPRLRFPDFREAGEWERKALSEFLFEYQQRNRDLKYGPQDVLSVSGEFGCVNQIELLGRSYAGVSVKDYRVVEPGDIVYTKSPLKKNPFGIIKENKGKPGIVSTLYAIYRAKENAHPAYFDHYFSRDYFLNAYLQPLVKKGAKNDMKVNNSVVLSGDVIAPKKDEQQKIAACLSSIDELITAETQKLDALKTHKKGLMQQLFPREGETVPRLRFPEFRGASAWSKVSAGKMFSNRIERGKSSLPIYSVTMTDGLVPRSSLDRKIDDIAETSANKTVRAGDLAYNMMRMWQGALGVAPQDCMVSPAYIVLEPQGVNPFFFYFLLKLPQSLRVLTAHSRGLTEDRLRLYYDDFAKVSLQCPSRPEQDRIADCLISVDNIIAVQSQKIDALKTHKKGLMQQLFPVLDEVTA